MNYQGKPDNIPEAQFADPPYSNGGRNQNQRYQNGGGYPNQGYQNGGGGYQTQGYQNQGYQNSGYQNQGQQQYNQNQYPNQRYQNNQNQYPNQGYQNNQNQYPNQGYQNNQQPQYGQSPPMPLKPENTIAQYNQQYKPGQQQYKPVATYGAQLGGLNNKVREAIGTKKVWEDLYDSSEPLKHGDYQWLQQRESFYIQQEIEVFDAIADQMGCGGCVETHNKYTVYDALTNEPLMFVQEVDTNQLEKCCFKPFHGAKLQVFDIRPGTTEKNKLMFLIDKPLKVCGEFCVCGELCSVQTLTYDSHGQPVGQTKQPIGGGGFTPTMISMSRDGHSFARTTGNSCCLGGVCENCCDSTFKVSHLPSNNMMAEIIKRKPGDGIGHGVSALTDADTFSIQLPLNMPLLEKMEMISSVILLDYLFFEYGAAVRSTDEGCVVTCCEMYCFGCLLPCTCTASNSS